MLDFIVLFPTSSNKTLREPYICPPICWAWFLLLGY